MSKPSPAPNDTELRERLWDIMSRRNEKILAAQKTDALVLPYFEADNEAATEIIALIAQDRARLLDRVEQVIATNQKGQFEDDAGNICWYLDDLQGAVARLRAGRSEDV